MILGMPALTFVHVLLSLVGIASGLLVLLAMFNARHSNGMTAVFLSTTVLTSATGFLFPFHKLLPSHIFGVISLLALAIAIYAKYGKQLAGGWNRTYVVTAVLSLYLNVFVLIAQAFMKVPALKPLAPTQSKPPFLVAQLVCLLLFIFLGVLAVKKFRTA
jgi:hypothetical protein